MARSVKLLDEGFYAITMSDNISRIQDEINIIQKLYKTDRSKFPEILDIGFIDLLNFDYETA